MAPGYRQVRWQEVGVGEIVYLQQRDKVIGPFYVRNKENKWLCDSKGRTHEHLGSMLVKEG